MVLVKVVLYLSQFWRMALVDAPQALFSLELLQNVFLLLTALMAASSKQITLVDFAVLIAPGVSH